MLLLRICITLVLLSGCASLFGQGSYNDSLQRFRDNYVKSHEVVKEADKKYLHFFPIDESYRVLADFQKTNESKWFSIETSGRERKIYRVFGTVSFTLHDTLIRLNLYQSQSLLGDPKYKDYLVLMFRDRTSGNETYETGRYLDVSIDDITKNMLTLDFNKAYNPYCAYVKGKYNCPIPPKENDMSIAIKAGEETYEKKAE